MMTKHYWIAIGAALGIGVLMSHGEPLDTGPQPPDPVPGPETALPDKPEALPPDDAIEWPYYIIPYEPESQPATYPEPRSPADWTSVWRDRLEIGLRIEHFTLKTRTRDYIDANGERQTFLGSIHHLEERRDQPAVRPVITWMPTKWIGLEASWDSIRVRTRTLTPDPTDGDFLLTGPMLSGVLRYPNSSPLTPYAGLGWVFYTVDFDHADWWHRGYPSYDNWVARGEPRDYRNGKERRFEPDDTRGMAWSLGCVVDVTKHLAIDVFYRRTSAEVDTHYTIWINDELFDDRDVTVFPLDHYAFGLGIRYRF